MKIQETDEYIMVKQITNQENKKNLISAAKAFAVLLSGIYLSIWMFAEFILWIKDKDISSELISLLWIQG
jgi:hypothetical protein